MKPAMTLTQAATWTRRGIVISVVLILLSILSVLAYNILYQYQKSQQKPVEEKPEMKFGNLPKLNFPPSRISSSNYSYTIDTVTGGLPKLPKFIKIYFIPQAGLSLMSPDRSRLLAEKLGFPNGPKVLSNTQYNFTDNNFGVLNIDITTGNFHFQKKIMEKNPVSSESAQTVTTSLPDENSLIQLLKDYLSSKNLMVSELASGRGSVSYNGPSAAQSETANVSIIPADFDSLPLVAPAFSHGLVRAKVTKSTEEISRFAKVDYTFWPIDTTTFSTYPLKTADLAFTNLKAGLGFVSIESPSPQVSITSISLAYFQSEEYSPYLQPVVVFEGPGFAALVPAVAQNAVTADQTNPRKN